MKSLVCKIVFGCALAGVMHGQLLAQAVVNEGLETTTLYVDAVAGNDNNPGTQALPFQTIGTGLGAAISNNQAGIGTQVIVNPGTYREVLSASQTARDTSLPITLQAATPGTVLISGGQLYTNWTSYSGNPSIYTTAWTNNWGLCVPNPGGPPLTDIVLRREMVLVNGAPMTQVLALSQVQFPGMFFVDETAGTLYIWPPAGVNPTTATVDVATQPTLLAVNSRDNIVFRGLTFQYANSCRDNGSVTVAGTVTNVIFDNDTFLWNNSLGLQISAPTVNFTVENSSALHNGESGFQISQTNFGLWQNDVSNYNNWRGALGAYYAWNSGGYHFYLAHNDTLNNITVAYNQTHGIHWDTDQYNITATGLHSFSNALNGLMVEASEGPVTISNSTSCNNDVAVHDSYNFQGGLLLRNSTNVTLTGSTLYGNFADQINLQGNKGGLTETNWETGEVYNLITSNITLTGNVIDALDGTQGVFSDSYLTDGDWTPFVTTLVSNSNLWWNPADTASFVVPTPVQSSKDNFAAWQALTGQDGNSTWAQPADPTAACNVPAEAPDFWLISSTDTPSIAVDGTATITASVAPIGGMTGTVNLAVNTSAVPGLTATVSPSSLTLDGKTTATATITYTASTALAAATYQIPAFANMGSVTRASTVLLTVPATSVRISTSSLAFGSQTIGTSSASQSLTLTNIGTTTLTITSIGSGSNFTQTNTCGSSVKAGASCTISVTFAPAQANSIIGGLTITDSDTTSSPQSVSLTGTGIARPTVTLTPNKLSNGTIAVGASLSQSATLTNSSTGTSVLAISSIVITGTNPLDYSQTNDCGSLLAAGATCTITVTFAPQTTGSLPATLTVTENSNGGSHSVTLTGTGATAAAASYSPASLSFANTTIGSTATSQTITVTNTSTTTTLTLNSVVLSGTSPGDFTLTDGCGGTLKANRTCTFTVAFKPTAAGVRTATITVNDSAIPATQTINLTGTGVEAVPLVAVAPGSLSFGTVTTGSTSAGQTFTVTNASIEAALAITSVTLSGSNPGDFAQTNNCPASLAAGASCTVTATFTPSAANARSANVVVNDNSSPASQTVTLSGTGSRSAPTVTLTPATLTFPSTNIGSSSTSQTATLKNTSAAVQLIVSSIALGGTNGSDYTLTNNCPASLGTGVSCTLTATFIPTAAGTRTATVTVTDNATGKTQTVTLTGTGNSPTPTVTVSPASLTFAATAVGSSSLSQQVTIKNTSASTALTITSIALSGTNKSDYSLSNGCGTSLAAGASCTATLTFLPTASGTRTATLTVTDNANPATQTVSLTGTAAVPTVSVTPASLSLGNVMVGSTSASQSVTIQNTSAAVSLSITSLLLSGTNASDYAVSNGCGSSLAAGASCTATVTFTPTVAAARTATLTLTDNASPATQTVSLSGTGTAIPTVTLSPSTLAFGNLGVGSTSTAKTATLTNTSTTAALTVTSIALGGANAGDFTVTNTCGTSLAAGASCTLTATFKPTVIGSRTATITITDNASPTTQTVSLTGTGTAPVPTVTVTPTTLHFGKLKVGSTLLKTVTVTNTSTNASAVLNFTSVKISSGLAFVQTNTCTAPLNAGQSCTITVTFLPTVTGLVSSSVTITDNASPKTQKVTLNGTGT